MELSSSLTVVQNPVEGSLVPMGTQYLYYIISDNLGGSLVCNTSFDTVDDAVPTVACPAVFNGFLLFSHFLIFSDGRENCFWGTSVYTDMVNVTTCGSSVTISQSPPVESSNYAPLNMTFTVTTDRGQVTTCVTYIPFDDTSKSIFFCMFSFFQPLLQLYALVVNCQLDETKVESMNSMWTTNAEVK
jgi:hypothetical protein